MLPGLRKSTADHDSLSTGVRCTSLSLWSAGFLKLQRDGVAVPLQHPRLRFARSKAS